MYASRYMYINDSDGVAELDGLCCIAPMIWCTYLKQLLVTSRVNFYITIRGVLDQSLLPEPVDY